MSRLRFPPVEPTPLRTPATTLGLVAVVALFGCGPDAPAPDALASALLGLPCATELAEAARGLGATGVVLAGPPGADGEPERRLATARIGDWIVVAPAGDGGARLRRVRAGSVEELVWDGGCAAGERRQAERVGFAAPGGTRGQGAGADNAQAAPTDADRAESGTPSGGTPGAGAPEAVASAAEAVGAAPSAGAAAPPAPFTDADLRAALATALEATPAAPALAVYVWSPHMPLAVDGYAELAAATAGRGVALLPVLFPGSDPGFARREADRVGIPPEGLRESRSVELAMRDAHVHAPAVLLFAPARISPLLPGYRDAEGYGRWIDAFLRS